MNRKVSNLKHLMFKQKYQNKPHFAVYFFAIKHSKGLYKRPFWNLSPFYNMH